MAWSDRGFEGTPNLVREHRLAELKELLRDTLTLELSRPDFTDPNSRTVKLMFAGEELSSVSFDVVQQREYEG